MPIVFNHPILQTREMIATANKFKYSGYALVNAGIPVETVSGDKVSWDIVEPTNTIDVDFVPPGAGSQPTQYEKVGSRTANLLHTFKNKPISAANLLNLRNIGTEREKSAQATIAREMDAMIREYSARRDEWMLWSMLKGTLTFTVEGVSQSISYGIPGGHTPTASVSWATSSTDILSDVNDWKNLIIQDSGRVASTMWMNSSTAMYLLNNDTLGTFFSSTAEGISMMREGHIQRLMGLSIRVYDGAYYDGGSVKFIPDDKVLIVPDFEADWISMVHGSNLVPFGDDLTETFGMAMYSEVSKDPIGMIMYLLYSRLPILKVPNCVIYAEVTP